MPSPEIAARSELRVLIAAVIILSVPLFAVAALAQDTGTARFTSPAEIDRAVADFTGAEAGEVGGARRAADHRLRLAACAGPLDVDWHGQGRSTVAVSCAGPESWRIFVATRPSPQASASAPSVKRGDPISVVVRGRGFSVQQAGEAMENGTVGEWIAIRTARDAAPIRARIERPGLAVIPAS